MNRAEKARATVDNDYIKEAFKEIIEACHQNIENSAHDQDDLREDMYYMLRAVKAFKRVLLSHIKSGQVENINELNIKRIVR